MIDPKHINDVVQNVMDNLPAGLKQLPDDVKQHIRNTVIATFEKLDLVTREEFDVQRKVLLRTREKLEALEKKLADQ